MKKISFILPMYNVEAYVEKCIRSIQDHEMQFEDYEIIVINDGSPDNCEKIVRELKKEFSNLILINQKNAGVSAARNRGIKEATGEYLVFIDPDDFVNPNLLKKLYDKAKRDDLDILLSGRSLLKANGEVIHMLGYKDLETKLFDGPTSYHEKDRLYPVWDSSVGRLYKKSLIDFYEINFPEGVVHLEDGVFVRKIFSIAERVGFENFDFYQVFERPGSASRSNINSRPTTSIEDVISVKSLLDFKNKNKLNTNQLNLINTSIIKYGLLPLMRSIDLKSLTAFIRMKNLLKKEELSHLDTSFVEKSDYLQFARYYNQSPWLFAFIYIYKLTTISFNSKFR